MANTDNLEKALKRSDADLAVESFLKLPENERHPWLERVVALIAPAIARQHANANWSMLMSWAARLERTPSLLPSTEANDIAWALMWGALRTKDSQRAQRWFRVLEPELRASAPTLFAAVEGAVTGTPRAEAMRRFVEADPRLGHERARARSTPAVPVTAESAHAAVLALRGTTSFADFETTVGSWLSGAPEAVRPTIAEVAGSLALRETIKRLVQGTSNPLGPLALLRTSIERGRAPIELEGAALTALRLAAPSLRDALRDRNSLKLLGQISSAGLAYPSLQPVVVALLLQVTSTSATGGVLAEFIEGLCRVHLDAKLVTHALVALASGDPFRDDTYRPSPSLLAAVDQVLGTQASAFIATLAALELKVLDNLCQWAAFNWPLPLLQRMVIVVTPGLDDQAADSMVNLVLGVLVRFQPLAAGPVDHDEVLDRPLPRECRAFWQAVEPEMLPRAPDLVPLALRHSSTSHEQVMQLALNRKPTIAHLLELWDQLRGTGFAARVDQALFERYGRDLEALTRGVLIAEAMKLPVAFKRRLGAALVDVAVGKAPTPMMEKALLLTMRWAPKSRAKGKGKTPIGRKPPNKTFPF